MSSAIKDVGASRASSLKRQFRGKNGIYLPNELFFMIISSVQYHENYQNILLKCSYYDSKNLLLCSSQDDKSPSSCSSQDGKTAPFRSYHDDETYSSQDEMSQLCSASQDDKSHLSKYVKVLDLAACPPESYDFLTEEPLARLGQDVEVFVAARTTLCINCLDAVSQCGKLVRLDLSVIEDDLGLDDLMSVVSKLKSLKIFHFPRPRWILTSEDSGANNHEQSKKNSNWPDSLETFYISSYMDEGFIPAFEKAPSLRNLVIEDEDNVSYPVMDRVFKLTGSRIQNLKVDHSGDDADDFSNIFDNFPNLLHLSVWPCMILANGVVSMMNIKIEHPLRSITINLKRLDVILDTDFLAALRDLLADDLLPNIGSISLFCNWSVDHILSFFRQYRYSKDALLEYPSLAEELVNTMGSCLKRWSTSTSDFEESRVWLVGDSDVSLVNTGANATVFEITQEIISKIFRPALVHTLGEWSR